jgi:hypothetical protein
MKVSFVIDWPNVTMARLLSAILTSCNNALVIIRYFCWFVGGFSI